MRIRRPDTQVGGGTARRFFKGEWKVVAGSAIVASASATAEAAGLVLVAAVAEHIGSTGPVGLDLGGLSLNLTFAQAAWGASLLIAGAAAGRMGANYLTIRRRTSLSHQWRTELVDGFLNATFAYQSSKRRGEVIETAGQHANTAAHALEILANALNSVISMVILIAGALALDPFVASILLVGGGGLLLLLRPLSKRSKQLSGQVASLDVELGNHLDEMVRMSKDIKVYGALRRFEEDADTLATRSATTTQRVLVLNRAVPIAFQTAGLLLLLAALAISSNAGPTSITAIGGTALLLLRGISYGQQLSSFQQNIASSTPFVENVLRALADYRSNTETTGELDITSVETIEFDVVGYTYAPEAEPALEAVTCELKRPGIVGLVGPSGSGKSTLAQLLLRLLRPTSGSVIVNGVDVSEFRADSWRHTVSFVPQEAELIHGTVAENVAFFRDWVSEADVEAAIEAVGLSDLVRSMPQGLQTDIGPTFRQLSGGQKQRIGIARALVGKPSLFVLDEPTSALDDESEKWVMRAIGSLRGDCLVVIITHRASTRDYCDVILRLEDGHLSAIELASPPDGVERNQ